MTVRQRALVFGLLVSFACSSDAPKPTPVALRYHANQVGEIGGGDGEGSLSDVFGVAIAADGRAYISEPPFARVVEFDKDGAYIGAIGHRGKGPGEFQVPGALFWRGDSLAVSDFASGISLFDSAGNFQQRISFILDVPGTAFGGRPMLPLADGSVGVVADPRASGRDADQSAPELWLKTSRSGTVSDTLALLSLRGRTFSFEAHGHTQQGTHPLAWSPLIAVPPSATSFVIVDRPPASNPDSASFWVYRVNLRGDTVATRSIAYVPQPVTHEMVDSIVNDMAGRMARRFSMTPAALADVIRDQLKWPSYTPPVSALLLGSDGSVWIERETVGMSQVRWDILGRDLASLGQIQLPKDLEPKVVSRSALWAVKKDSLDVPHVLHFDVVKDQ